MWLSAAVLIVGSSLTFADDQAKPMHMHKSDMNHASDAQVATEHQSEAARLRAEAEEHKKLAELYRSRTPPKGGSYETVARHCDRLGKFYEDAAKEAEAISTELAK
jgi:hypothetical protein